MVWTLINSGPELLVMLRSLRFFMTLASSLVPSYVLGLCLVSWVFYCASKVLLEVLIIGSPRRLHPSHVCILLDYKTITWKLISLTWSCWSSNTKIQIKWAKVHFRYNLPYFGDWWQHDENKQIIIDIELKTYLLARMQCKGKFLWC
jgi:hypothetical protein